MAAIKSSGFAVVTGLTFKSHALLGAAKFFSKLGGAPTRLQIDPRYLKVNNQLKRDVFCFFYVVVVQLRREGLLDAMNRPSALARNGAALACEAFPKDTSLSLKPKFRNVPQGGDDCKLADAGLAARGGGGRLAPTSGGGGGKLEHSSCHELFRGCARECEVITTAAGAHFRNGKVEQLHQTLKGCVRAMLLHSILSVAFWYHVLQHAVLISNLLSVARDEKLKSLTALRGNTTMALSRLYRNCYLGLSGA
jgi:hypothetical protein